MLKFQTHILKPNVAFKVLNEVKIEYDMTEESKWRGAFMPAQVHMYSI